MQAPSSQIDGAERVSIYDIYTNLVLTTSAINAFASLLTLYLMFSLEIRRSNRLQMLVALMTISQFFYDASLIFSVECSYFPARECNSIYQGVSKFFNFNLIGLCTVMSVCVLYIVIFKKPASLSLRSQILIAFIPSFIFGFLTGYYRYCSYIDEYASPSTYPPAVFFNSTWLFIIDYARSFFIFFDVAILIYGAVYIAIFERSEEATKPGGKQFSMLTKELIRRLFWQPVVQSVARIFTSYYVLKWPPSTTSYLSAHYVSTEQTTALFLYAIFAPSAGVGWFLALLCVQNGARQKFLELICLASSRKKDEDASSELAVIEMGAESRDTLDATNSVFFSPLQLIYAKDEEEIMRDIGALKIGGEAVVTSAEVNRKQNQQQPQHQDAEFVVHSPIQMQIQSSNDEQAADLSVGIEMNNFQPPLIL